MDDALQTSRDVFDQPRDGGPPDFSGKEGRRFTPVASITHASIDNPQPLMYERCPPISRPQRMHSAIERFPLKESQ
jgi:hypothetical protein